MSFKHFSELRLSTVPDKITFNVKVSLPTGLVAMTSYIPKSSGINEVRCRVEMTGGEVGEELEVMFTRSILLLRMLPAWLQVILVRGRLNLVIFTESMRSFPASSSGDAT